MINPLRPQRRFVMVWDKEKFVVEGNKWKTRRVKSREDE